VAGECCEFLQCRPVPWQASGTDGRIQRERRCQRPGRRAGAVDLGPWEGSTSVVLPGVAQAVPSGAKLGMALRRLWWKLVVPPLMQPRTDRRHRGQGAGCHESGAVAADARGQICAGAGGLDCRTERAGWLCVIKRHRQPVGGPAALGRAGRRSHPDGRSGDSCRWPGSLLAAWGPPAQSLLADSTGAVWVAIFCRTDRLRATTAETGAGLCCRVALQGGDVRPWPTGFASARSARQMPADWTSALAINPRVLQLRWDWQLGLAVAIARSTVTKNHPGPEQRELPPLQSARSSSTIRLPCCHDAH